MNKYKVDFTVGTPNNVLSKGSIKASSLSELQASMESIYKLVEIANNARAQIDQAEPKPLVGSAKLRVKFSNSKCTIETPDLETLIQHSEILDAEAIAP